MNKLMSRHKPGTNVTSLRYQAALLNNPAAYSTKDAQIMKMYGYITNAKSLAAGVGRRNKSAVQNAFDSRGHFMKDI